MVSAFCLKFLKKTAASKKQPIYGLIIAFCLLQDSLSGIKRASLKVDLLLRLLGNKFKSLLGVAQSTNCKQEAAIMSKVCQVTGKRPMAGNNVSHAKNRTRRRFEPNLHTHRFWIESEKRFVKLRVSTKGMRIIDKNGIENVLASLRANGEKI